jgi:hypothetical protein
MTTFDTLRERLNKRLVFEHAGGQFWLIEDVVDTINSIAAEVRCEACPWWTQMTGGTEMTIFDMLRERLPVEIESLDVIFNTFAAEVRCDRCANGDNATIDGKPEMEPNVYCGLEDAWFCSGHFCSEWKARA